jgi:Methyltransferase domain
MSAHFNPLSYPILFSSPRRLSPYSGWHQHIPFAMFLLGLLKPGTLVELGTFSGDSYCAFCQAVQELKLSTRCYAIDTWEGDPDTGYYGPDVLESLKEHHDPLYGSFSRLIKSTFDEAAKGFSDGTIDLLHIDGYHAHDVAKHDFESWLPKMSEQGVILLHDVNVREGDFGVWKLWEEISQEYPHFEFIHGHGLGVLAVGKKQPEPFQAFLGMASEDGLLIRNFFFQLGLRLSLKGEHLAQLSAEREEFKRESQLLEETIRAQERATREREITKLTEERQRTLAQKDERIGKLVEDLEQLELEHAQIRQQLAALESSLAWRLNLKSRKVRDGLFPNGTKRRALFDRVKDSFKVLIR